MLTDAGRDGVQTLSRRATRRPHRGAPRCTVGGQRTGHKPDRGGFESQPCCSLAVRPWASHCASRAAPSSPAEQKRANWQSQDRNHETWIPALALPTDGLLALARARGRAAAT